MSGHILYVYLPYIWHMPYGLYICIQQPYSWVGLPYTVWLYNTHMHKVLHICIIFFADRWLFDSYLYNLGHLSCLLPISARTYVRVIYGIRYIYAIYFKNILLAATLLMSHDKSSTLLNKKAQSHPSVLFRWQNPHQSRNMFQLLDHWIGMAVLFLYLGSHWRLHSTLTLYTPLLHSSLLLWLLLHTNKD
jgi:hypothetical protein